MLEEGNINLESEGRNFETRTKGTGRGLTGCGGEGRGGDIWSRRWDGGNCPLHASLQFRDAPAIAQSGDLTNAKLFCPDAPIHLPSSSHPCAPCPSRPILPSLDDCRCSPSPSLPFPLLVLSNATIRGPM
eukprot:758584-Hanusia_phi.AAC.2